MVGTARSGRLLRAARKLNESPSLKIDATAFLKSLAAVSCRLSDNAIEELCGYIEVSEKPANSTLFLQVLLSGACKKCAEHMR